MQFLKNADEDVTCKELSVFVSHLPSESMVTYKNSTYIFKQVIEDTTISNILEFIESKLFSVGKMNAKILFVNVVSKRAIKLVTTRNNTSEVTDLPFIETLKGRQDRLVEMALEEAVNIEDYYSMTWVLHNETLDKDHIIAMDTVIYDSDSFRQVKALIFDWQYTRACKAVELKYEQLLFLKAADGSRMIPNLEQLKESEDETD